ncbi:MAG TPA: hypothetical protein VER38_05405 [Candidatus Eisenbacteria bacterium]|nr:hypothetical protein [Candidatus Eisenbacteria bacterium]
MALIRLDHVTKYYRDRLALSDVSLSFEPSEWVFITGPSGPAGAAWRPSAACAARSGCWGRNSAF